MPSEPIQKFSDGLRAIEALARISDAADGEDHVSAGVVLPCRHWAVVEAIIRHAMEVDEILSRLEMEISLRFVSSPDYADAPNHMSEPLKELIIRARGALNLPVRESKTTSPSAENWFKLRNPNAS